MSKPTANPPRLSSLRDDEDSFAVGRMFREARELPDEELPRLRWRLRTSQQLRAMRPRLFLRVALVVGLAFLMGGVVGAVISPFWARRKAAVVVSSPPVATKASSHRRRRAGPASSMPAVTTEPISSSDEPLETSEADAEVTEAEVTELAAEALATSAGAAESPAVAKPVAGVTAPALGANEPKLVVPAPAKAPPGTRVALRGEATPPIGGARNAPAMPRPMPRNALPAPPPAEFAPPAALPPVASPIAVEQALLGQAMAALRRGHDARTALSLLAQHEERFPQGAFAAEATELRIEALLALGQRDEALAVLDGTALASLPNRDEQRVVRGELRAAHRRWREAAQDFDALLGGRTFAAASSHSHLRSLQERALWGRAAARSRLGDEKGARTDLDLYLRSFPGGQFAGLATSLLKGAP